MIKTLNKIKCTICELSLKLVYLFFCFSNRVKDYVRRQQSVTLVERSMRAELSVLEQKLLESQDLIEVRGKVYINRE